MADQFVYTPIELKQLFNAWRRQESSKGRGLVLITAGKTGSGKSTLVKNLLGPGLSKAPRPGHSSSSVTADVECYTNVIEDVSVTIADVPGLAGEPGTDENRVIAQLQKETNGKADMLLYCASMAPSSKIGDADLKIVKLLTLVYKQKIWKRAILVLTSADYVRERHEKNSTANPTVESTMADYAQKFGQILRSANVNSFTITPIKPNEKLSTRERPADEIAAVPAGETPDEKTISGVQWDLCVYLEVIKKCDFEAVSAILSVAEAEFLKNKPFITGASTAVGIAAGAAAVGTAAGFPLGVVGAVPGALIGGAVGGISGFLGRDAAFRRFLNNDQIKLIEIQRKIEQEKTAEKEDKKQK